MDSNISLCYTTIMNKPVIFKFTTQKEKHNTYLYFANDKRFPYHVYATAYEILSIFLKNVLLILLKKLEQH